MEAKNTFESYFFTERHTGNADHELIHEMIVNLVLLISKPIY